MSASVLRRAAVRIRHDVDFGQAHGDDAFLLAVAAWLDSTANDVEHVHTPVYNLTSTTVARAITVARAYLGES